MQRRSLTVLAVMVVCLLIAASIYAQQAPAAGGAGAGGGGGRGGGAGAGGGRGAGGGGGQAAAGGGARGNTARIPLFFKEEWKDVKNVEQAVTQEWVSNPNLELKLYGQNHDVLITGGATIENNPTHVWTGTCTTACAVALRDKNNFADITGLARMKWISKMSGYHEIRPIVKLASGTWLIGDHSDSNNVDWLTHEFSFQGMRWLTLDIARVVTTGTWVANPDLTKIDEIGFADLMPGSGHGAGGWSDVATIEVYAKTVARQ